MATNYNIQNGKDLDASDIYDKSLLAFNDNATFKLTLNKDTQKILNAANLLIGQSSEQAAHAEIFNDYIDNEANGHYSHVEGQGNIAFEDHQHVQGRYNKDGNDSDFDDLGTLIHVVGCGTNASDRKNCHLLDDTGNAWYANKVVADHYFWARNKYPDSMWSGSLAADTEIYLRHDEDGQYGREGNKGYHKVPVVYFGEDEPDNNKGQIGDIYCMIL